MYQSCESATFFYLSHACRSLVGGKWGCDRANVLLFAPRSSCKKSFDPKSERGERNLFSIIVFFWCRVLSSFACYVINNPGDFKWYFSDFIYLFFLFIFNFYLECSEMHGVPKNVWHPLRCPISEWIFEEELNLPCFNCGRNKFLSTNFQKTIL